MSGILPEVQQWNRRGEQLDPERERGQASENGAARVAPPRAETGGKAEAGQRGQETLPQCAESPQIAGEPKAGIVGPEQLVRHTQEGAQPGVSDERAKGEEYAPESCHQRVETPPAETTATHPVAGPDGGEHQHARARIEGCYLSVGRPPA